MKDHQKRYNQNSYKAQTPRLNMKKSAVIMVLLLILFSFSVVIAAENETSQDDKIQKAFSCLEEKAGDCSSLTTQEIALTIMATPSSEVFDSCTEELISREDQNHWENIKDTSLAIIALKHAGENTEEYENWLIAQNQSPVDLIWYLQEDSNEASECHIGYSSQDYVINIGEDKKISKDAGACLSRTQSNFWLQVSGNCYEESFQIGCDKDFMANLIYRNKNSPTIYVLDGTSSAPAFGSVELQIKSKCFGDSSCDYEATAWATLALLETGHNVEEYVPYVIAMSETNSRYLPESFIFILTNFEDYANALINEQKLGNYWEATSSSYDKYYDTGLALLALASSTSEQVIKAKDWALFAQGGSGCWQNSVRDTAMMLWALEGRAGRVSSSEGTGNTVTYCTQADFFCIPSNECSGTEDVGDNYFCPSLSDTCCTSENLKMCTEYNGEVCDSDQVCIGNSRKASDTNTCCTGSCEEASQESECEANYYTCMDSCSEFQEPMSAYSCNQGQMCCKTKSTSSNDSGSNWWMWLLIILILAVLIAIAYFYREQLKLYWFQLRSKFKKDDGKDSKSSSGPPTIPPRPGFPPARRPRPIMPPRRNLAQNVPPRKSYDRRDKAMSETFQKLKDMSK